MAGTHDDSIEMTTSPRASTRENITTPASAANTLNTNQTTQQSGSGTQARDIISHLLPFWRDSENEDALERYLGPRSASDPASRQLLRSYNSFKSEPSGELFGSLLSFRTAQRFDSSLSAFEYLEIEPETQFASCLEELRIRLRGSDTSYLQICVLSNFLPDDVRLGDRSFTSKIFASTESLDSSHETPLLAVLQVVQGEWQLGTKLEAEYRGKPRMAGPQSISLPSKLTIKPMVTLSSSEWTVVKLTWVGDLIEYSRDSTVYIWQPHLQHVESAGASVFISPSNANPLRVVVLLNPPTLGKKRLRELIEKLHSGTPVAARDLSGFENGIRSTLVSVYSLLISDTTDLIQNLSRTIETLTFSGRQYPSVSKIHYTLYLSDCQRASSQAMEDALKLLSQIRNTSEMSSGESSPSVSPETQVDALETWADSIKTDILYLGSCLEDLGAKVAELRREIKDQLDLQQIRRSRTLAFLAAIYLPFSFVSGFFGMNVSDPLWKGHRSNSADASTTPSPVSLARRVGSHASRYSSSHTFSLLARALNSTNSTLSDTSNGTISLSQNQTDSIIAAISTSGPHLFTFQTFLIVVFTITFATIVLPMVAGAIFRWILQWTNRYKGHWRALIFVICLAVTFTVKNFSPELPFILIFGIPQVSLALYFLGKTRLLSKRWIVYDAILALSIVLDAWSLGYDVGFEDVQTDLFLGFTGFLPLLYLLILGTIKDGLFILKLRISTPNSRFRSVATAISTTFTRYRKSWIWSLAGLWLIFHGVSCFVLSPVPAGIIFTYSYGIFFALYGVGRLFVSRMAVEWDISIWAPFLGMVCVSFGVDVLYTRGFLLATIPALYLVAYKFMRNDQDFITTYFPRWMNFRT